LHNEISYYYLWINLFILNKYTNKKLNKNYIKFKFINLYLKLLALQAEKASINV